MSWTPRIAADSNPLYVAIADAIADDAESGRLAPGTRMPTHRALATALGVDVTTVSRAYAEATRRGLIAGHVGRGTYVRGARPPLISTRSSGIVDLTVNLPPEPSDACDAAVRKTLGELSRSADIAPLLTYAPFGGSTPHREAGATWCTDRGVAASPDRVLVCGGRSRRCFVLSAHVAGTLS